MLSFAATYAIWRHAPIIALPLGVVSCLLGWASGFSGGFFTIIPGTLALVAGLVALIGRKRPNQEPTVVETAAPPLP